MKEINIVTVCGSGVVTSSMVALKLTEKLAEHGYKVNATEANPNTVATAIQGKHFDIMACISPVNEDYGIPKVNAIPMLAGRDKKVVQDCLKILENL